MGRILIFFFFPIFVFSANFSLFTIPKSGTHVLIKLFRNPEFNRLEPTNQKELINNPLFYYSVHFSDPFDECIQYFSSEHKFIVNVRDFRDVAVSMVDWCIERNKCPFICGNKISCGQVKQAWFDLSYTEKIKAFFQPDIWGKSWLMKELEKLEKFLLFVPQDKCYLTSFEKLVGSKGGGDSVQQQAEIQKIATFLGIHIHKKTIKLIADSLYGDSYTYRQGRIGRWKEIFDEELIELSNQYLESSQLRCLIEYKPKYTAPAHLE